MICRLCLTATEFCLPLKNAENQVKREETENIAEIIKKHFDLELDIDCDFVCTVCWQQISDFHAFYLFIQEKQKELGQAIIGTGNDATPNATDYGYVIIMKDEVAAQDENGMDIKNECLMDLNAPPVVTENNLQQWDKGATPQEAFENLDIKKELVDDADAEVLNYEPSTTNTETDSEYETDMTDEDDDDDEVEMKDESLIEISNQMMTENSLGQWNKKATENLEDIKNVELINQVDTESVSCATDTNEITETKDTKQSKRPPTVEKQQDLDKKIRREKSDLIIAKHAGILKCELCAQTVDSFGSLKQHFKKEHGRKGYVRCCNKRYYLRYTYAEHLEWHSNPNLWKCEPCNLVLSCRDSYENHMLQVHPAVESSKIQCTLCPARFSHGYLLRRHMKSQHCEKNFKCDECNREFTTAHILKNHIKTIHLNAYRTECDICGKSFVNNTNCNIHKAQVHQVAENLNYQCPHCSQKFAFLTLLNKHKRDCHTEQKCDECNKEFKSRDSLKQHIKAIHLRVYDIECDICGKIIANRSSLNVHKARVHGVEEYLNFQCPSCPKKFALQNLLDVHREDTHSREIYKCDECGKEFNSSNKLRGHKRRFHLRADDTECDICGKVFASRSRCKVHKASIHQVGEGLNFQCSNCPKKFALKGILNVHRKEVHSEQNLKCDECEKEFKSLGSLKQHKRRFHKIFANSTRSRIQKSNIN